jgi:ATP-dependent helicase/nuclease subunit B
MLRQCPYRFFSRVALHLSEPDELDDDAGKRDAGQWLHATLERFHLARPGPRPSSDDIDRFVVAGDAVLADLAHTEGLSAAAMLPFSAGLPALAERYVRWLHEQESLGWSFTAAELRIEPLATGCEGLMLHGRIDRIDTRAGEGTVRLIDYKTSSRKSLEDKVRAPLEDTQLAVYAALQLARQPDTAVEACYLALDETDEAVAVMHHQVADSARVLTQQIAAERARIEAGAALPALGEGTVCETCEARGLCRRDHWSDPAEVPAGVA